MISTTCNLNVAKGEEAPQLTSVGKVNGVAHKECNWQVPYKVRGFFCYNLIFMGIFISHHYTAHFIDRSMACSSLLWR